MALRNLCTCIDRFGVFVLASLHDDGISADQGDPLSTWVRYRHGIHFVRIFCWSGWRQSHWRTPSGCPKYMYLSPIIKWTLYLSHSQTTNLLKSSLVDCPESAVRFHHYTKITAVCASVSVCVCAYKTGGQWKPFENTGLSLNWVAYKLQEGCYSRHMPQG